MLELHNRLCRKDEEVVAKVMDGEAVIINLANGRYYSMEKVGGAVWGMIEDGCRLDEIVAVIAARYDVEIARLRADVLQLVTALLREELLSMASDDETPLRQPEPEAAHKLLYETPQLNTYTDMEDLLALDPPTPGLSDLPWKE
jgi:hypothetical protein